MGLRDRYEFEKERGGHPEGFNIGAMEKIVAAKAAALIDMALRRAEAAERRVAELEGAVRVLVAECGQWRGAKVLNPISLIDAPIRRAVCNTNANPIAKAAIDEAGGQHD